MRTRRLSVFVLLPVAAALAGCDVFEPDDTPAFAAIAVGARHGCALDAGGRAYCWGANDQGQLGTGDGEFRLTATPVAGDLRFRALEAVDDRTCGLDVVGRVYCWGANDWGQIGDGSMARRNAPTVVRWGMRFVELSLGTYHACGRRADGEVYCWGRNTWGAIGGPVSHTCGADMPCNRLPTRVAGGMRFTRVEAGLGHTCALGTDSRAYCWGWNEHGQLGDGSEAMLRSTPAPVAGDRSFVRLMSGPAHTCGEQDDGGIFCWGSDLGSGGLGDGRLSDEPRRVPVAMSSESPLLSVQSSKENFLPHACGFDAAGSLWCWGLNDRGQLGAHAASDCGGVFQAPACAAAPVRADVQLGFQVVKLGRSLTCGLTRAGEAWCWGANEVGQQGNGRTQEVDPPSRVLFPGERATAPGERPLVAGPVSGPAAPDTRAGAPAPRVAD